MYSLRSTAKPPEPIQREPILNEAGAATSIPIAASVSELMNDVMDVQVQQLAAHVNHLKSQLARAKAEYENAVMAQYFHRAALKAGDLVIFIPQLP